MRNILICCTYITIIKFIVREILLGGWGVGEFQVRGLNGVPRGKGSGVSGCQNGGGSHCSDAEGGMNDTNLR